MMKQYFPLGRCSLPCQSPATRLRASSATASSAAGTLSQPQRLARAVPIAPYGVALHHRRAGRQERAETALPFSRYLLGGTPATRNILASPSRRGRMHASASWKDLCHRRDAGKDEVRQEDHRRQGSEGHWHGIFTDDRILYGFQEHLDADSAAPTDCDKPPAGFVYDEDLCSFRKK